MTRVERWCAMAVDGSENRRGWAAVVSRHSARGEVGHAVLR
jgi:hypothetical protein